jgi:hypothetical protein
MRHLRIPAALAVALAILLGAVAAHAQDPIEFRRAEKQLTALKKRLASRGSTNEEILAALEDVAKAYKQLQGPPRPETVALPEDATAEQVRAAAKENERKMRAWLAEKQRFDRRFGRFGARADALFIKAMVLQKPVKGSRRNERSDVNVRAALILGETGSPTASEEMRDALEASVLNGTKVEVPETLYVEAFIALARLGDLRSLTWLDERFVHGRLRPVTVLIQSAAAHEAMLHFENVPGQMRLKLVKHMVEMYIHVEASAAEPPPGPIPNLAKPFWDRVGSGVVRALQHFAGDPYDDEGMPIRSVTGFKTWLEANGDPKADAWKD